MTIRGTRAAFGLGASRPLSLESPSCTAPSSVVIPSVPWVIASRGIVVSRLVEVHVIGSYLRRGKRCVGPGELPLWLEWIPPKRLAAAPPEGRDAFEDLLMPGSFFTGIGPEQLAFWESEESSFSEVAQQELPWKSDKFGPCCG